MLNNTKGRLVSALLVAGSIAAAGCATIGGSSLAPLTRSVPAARAILPDAMRPDVRRLQSSGATPWAGLINIGPLLYGTTQYGGASNEGVVYKITTGGVEKPIHSFAGPPDGAYPTGPVLRVVACSCLYGTTQSGGTSNKGTIFASKFSGGDNILHNFVGSDGSDPEGRLIEVGSAVYGTTYSGGANGVGTVFKITISGSVLTTLHTFGATNADGGFRMRVCSTSDRIFTERRLAVGPATSGPSLESNQTERVTACSIASQAERTAHSPTAT